ncbi:hypothetical protein BDEG_25999 [Batrachochytrium dendrobatidis JEL423]|uniref:Uncharacterized protein n=1 Tax=Batrachochytrium dendrobatidis (strain JEL423) TaxID=403673 RepID=A0A177WT15_BATDL|nr:hypothetical protein BDEG_25999 [Batrachochytrium dendrobatidis JEL423]
MEAHGNARLRPLIETIRSLLGLSPLLLNQQYVGRVTCSIDKDASLVVASKESATTNSTSDQPAFHIQVSQRFLQEIQEHDGQDRALAELEGLMVFALVAELWTPLSEAQVPDWLGSGIADYIRLKAGLAPPHWNRMEGNSWEDGYSTTAYFLDWVETNEKPNLVHELVKMWSTNELESNQILPWSHKTWEQLVGSTLETTWNAYQNSLTLEINQTHIHTVCVPDHEDGWPAYHLAHHVLVDAQQARLFRSAVPDPIEWLRKCLDIALRLLYIDPSHAPRWFQTVRLILRQMDGVAHTIHADAGKSREIHISVQYISSVYSGRNNQLTELQSELNGVLVHELVHVIQYNGFDTAPSWLIEGIADYVRLHANLAPPHWRCCRGGSWEDGYDRCAYFLDWNDAQLLKRQQYSNGQLTQQQNDTKLRRVVQLNMLLKSRKWKNNVTGKLMPVQMTVAKHMS